MHLNSRVGSFCRFLSTRKYAIKLTLLLVSRCFQLETCTQQDAQSNFPQGKYRQSTLNFPFRLSMTSAIERRGLIN